MEIAATVFVSLFIVAFGIWRGRGIWHGRSYYRWYNKVGMISYIPSHRENKWVGALYKPGKPSLFSHDPDVMDRREELGRGGPGAFKTAQEAREWVETEHVAKPSLR